MMATAVFSAVVTFCGVATGGWLALAVDAPATTRIVVATTSEDRCGLRRRMARDTRLEDPVCRARRHNSSTRSGTSDSSGTSSARAIWDIRAPEWGVRFR